MLIVSPAEKEHGTDIGFCVKKLQQIICQVDNKFKYMHIYPNINIHIDVYADKDFG